MNYVDYDYWSLDPWIRKIAYPIPKETKPQRSSIVVKLDQMEEMGLERIGVSTFKVPEEFFVTTNNSLPIPEIVIDFTAIDENRFVEYMCKRIFSEGIKLGRKEVSTQLNTILSYANEED